MTEPVAATNSPGRWVDYDDGHAGGYPHWCNEPPVGPPPVGDTTPPTPVGGHFIDGRWHGCDPNYCDLDHGVAPPAQPQPTDRDHDCNTPYGPVCWCEKQQVDAAVAAIQSKPAGPDFGVLVAALRALAEKWEQEAVGEVDAGYQLALQNCAREATAALDKAGAP